MNEGFFAHLKQRKLVQWGLAYIAAAFSLIQVVDVAAESYHWPDVAMHLLFGVLALGFVVTLLLAWYHGERGAQHVSGPELLLITLALAIGGGLLWRFGGTGWSAASPHPASGAGATASAHAGSGVTADTAMTETIPDKSVAVLPFANESGDGAQQYFSDGLSDDLITALSQVDGLKVISRNSAFQFRNSKDSSAEIGKLLGVAHLLEGSVQRAGNEVRITATLVNAATGTILWSERYDKPYKDLFALQDDITHAVAGALKAKLLTAPGAVSQSDRPASGNLAAYNDLLMGHFYGSKLTAAGRRKAIDFYRQAIARDPHYAAAYASLGYVLTGLSGGLTGAEQQQAFAEARTAAATAVSLAPDLGVAHLVQGYVLRQVDGDVMGALAEYRRGFDLEPNNGGAMDSLGHELAALGQLKAAIALYRKAIVADPLRTVTYYNLSIALAALGQLDEAEQVARKGIELRPDNPSVQYALLTVELLRGKTAAVLQSADIQASPFRQLWFQAAAYSIAGDQAKADAALKSFQARYAAKGAYEIAELYALRRQPEPMFVWLDRDGAQPAPRAATDLLSDPWLVRYKDDPRFAAFCKKVGLPTTTDAVAMK